MITLGRPTFEVVTAADAAGRLLVSVETIRDLTGIAETGDGSMSDAALEALIRAALAQCAKSCKVATHRAAAPTLAQEAVRATWLPASSYDALAGSRPADRPSLLLLPWRAPIISIEVAEGETELVEGTDFRLLEGGLVERIGACWDASEAIVVDYTAGFAPKVDYPEEQEGEPMPDDLVPLLADQVRMAADRRDIDLNLRSEDVAGVWSGTYNVAGGSAIDTSGLILPLYEALRPYRAPPAFA